MAQQKEQSGLAPQEDVGEHRRNKEDDISVDHGTGKRNMEHI